MDAKTQADVFSIMIDKGVLNPNECRELLERNPRVGGDQYVNPAGPKVVAAPAPAPRPAEPDEDDSEDDSAAAEAATAQALAAARAIAQARAVELLEEEQAHLVRLAREHSRKAEAWPGAVARFYGHFAGRVSVALACEKATAKAWCEARRGLVLNEGPAGLANVEQAAAALVALSLSNGG
jgi:hypothetical protein